VRPSFIRVEADEVTYDLHVALRFEIERALIEGTLAFADVPARWNERFHELTGLKVPDDSQGCLQDVHWAHGLIGYFPTYSLGNLASSQLFAKFAQENPGWQAEVRTGSGASILSWMRDRIHRHGRRLTPDQLLRAATGEPLNAAHHITYLRGKFAG
jgi:carboxypeptidase Taq